ncbi:UNVERIFIED_CONTAM: hypothetical protein K2H54_061564 [Gekko kuhli]
MGKPSPNSTAHYSTPRSLQSKGSPISLAAGGFPTISIGGSVYHLAAFLPLVATHEHKSPFSFSSIFKNCSKEFKLLKQVCSPEVNHEVSSKTLACFTPLTFPFFLLELPFHPLVKTSTRLKHTSSKQLFADLVRFKEEWKIAN